MNKVESAHLTKEERTQFFTILYQKAFPAAARYVNKMGGTLEEAKDIFQDALIIYYETVVLGRVDPEKSDIAYILGISKNLWIKRFNQNSKNVSLNETNITECLEDKTKNEIPILLSSFLANAGQKCLELLQSFYYNQSSMATLAKQFGYASIHSATVQKYKCLEKVRDHVKQKSLTYEDFFA